MDEDITRRGFLTAAALLPITCQTDRVTAAAPLPASEGPLILFQGDSITDGGRDPHGDGRNSSSLGFGYPLLVAAAILGARSGEGFKFLNRGISGNRSGDLRARWHRDALSLRPSVISVLIGVNDYVHRRSGFYDGTVEDYRANYHEILSRASESLPGVRLIVLEPFLIRSDAVSESSRAEFGEYRTASRAVAANAGAVFVELQGAFDALSSVAPQYWSPDGIHPTLAGHAVIAQRWQTAFAL